MIKRNQSLLAVAGLAVVVIAVLFESLFLDRIVVGIDTRVFAPFSHLAQDSEFEAEASMNCISLDLAAWLVPERLSQIESFAAGRAPLWNAREGLGQPLLATLGDAPFYPGRLLDLVLTPLHAIAVSLALHVFLLGAGTWLVMRRAGLHPAAAWLGALVMALSGYASSHYQAPLILRAIAWLPWIHLALARLIERPSLARCGVLGLAMGMSFLVGFPQVSCFSVYAGLLITLPRQRRALVAVAAAGALGAAIASVHMIPAVELMTESWRAGGWSLEAARDKSLAPQSLIGFALPHFFGSPVQDISLSTPALPNPWEFPSYLAWQTQEVQNNFEENVLYVGLIPLALAAMGFWRRGRARLAALGLVAAVAVAMSSPILGYLAGHLPGISYGSPKRVLFLAAYALAWLAAFEVDRIARTKHSESRKSGLILLFFGVLSLCLGLSIFLPFESWLFPKVSISSQEWFRSTVARDLLMAVVAGLSLILAGLAFRSGRVRTTILVLLATTTVELLTFARHTNPPQDADSLYPETPAITWLLDKGASKDSRFLNFGDQTVLIASVAQVFGLRSCNAMAGLLPRRPSELLRAIEPGCLKLNNPGYIGPLLLPESLGSPILDLLGIRFVVAGVSGYAALGEGLPQIGLSLAYGNESERLAIYERSNALPPAFLVQELAVERDAEKRLTRMSKATFDPSQLALLGEPIPHPHSGLASGTVHYERIAPEVIQLEVQADGPAFLVVTENFMPGWRCEIDGKSADMFLANHALMGVPLPANAKKIRLIYDPHSFRAGWIISLLGLVTSLGLITQSSFSRFSK